MATGIGYAVELMSDRYDGKWLRQATYWDESRAKMHADNLRYTYGDQPDVKIRVRKVKVTTK